MKQLLASMITAISLVFSAGVCLAAPDDPFARADAMVQVCGGILPLAFVVILVVGLVLRARNKRQESSLPRTPATTDPGNTGDTAGMVGASDAAPGSLDDAGIGSQVIPEPRQKTVTGFARVWIIFWIVGNCAAALAPANRLTDPSLGGIVALVMLLSVAVAVGYILLYFRNPFGLYLVLIANALGIPLNGIHVPGYSVTVTTGLVMGIITFFITRKQIAYPFGKSSATDEPTVAALRAPAASPTETSRLAIASLATGIATWFVLPVIGAIAAVITGHLAKKQIRREPNRFGGSGVATAGLVLGYVHLGLALVIGGVMGAMLIAARPAAQAMATAVPHGSTISATAVPVRAAAVKIPTTMPAARCTVQDGQWTGMVGFTASGCVLSEPVLTLASSQNGMVTIYYVYLHDDIRVTGDQLSYQGSQDGGQVRLKGRFTSPTHAEGTWVLTKGTQIAGGRTTLTQDASGDWTASLGSTPTAAVATVAVPPTAAPTWTTRPRPSATASSTPAPTPAAQATTTVLGAQVQKFFAPGPNTAGIAIAGDTVWLADTNQRRIHHLDASGAPLGSFAVQAEGEFRGLTWDGEALRLLVRDYRTGSQVLRLDTQGAVLAQFTVPADLHGLAWDPADRTLWTIASQSDGFLLELSADGGLQRTLAVPVFGSPEALAWAPDGLWVLSGFGKWHRFSAAGDYLASADLPMEVFAKSPALAWDPRGYLWVSVADTREVYQFGVRQAAADMELPPEMRSAAAPRAAGEQPLPASVFRAVPGSTHVLLYVANGLPAPLSLALDSLSGGAVHESAVVAPGETWTGNLSKGGTFTLFASANVAQPIAFSDKILLLGGYEYTWTVGNASTVHPIEPADTASVATSSTQTPVPTSTSAPQPTAALAARAPAPTRATIVAPVVCPDPRVRITYPANGAVISGVTNFIGTAALPDQAYYKFEYKLADGSTWQYLTRFDGKSVTNDKLMDFFTTTIAPGAYDFRLIAVDRGGNYPVPCEIRVTVRR